MASISALTVSCTYKKGVVNNNIQQEQQPGNVLIDVPLAKKLKNDMMKMEDFQF